MLGLSLLSIYILYYNIYIYYLNYNVCDYVCISILFYTNIWSINVYKYSRRHLQCPEFWAYKTLAVFPVKFAMQFDPNESGSSAVEMNTLPIPACQMCIAPNVSKRRFGHLRVGLRYEVQSKGRESKDRSEQRHWMTSDIGKKIISY